MPDDRARSTAQDSKRPQEAAPKPSSKRAKQVEQDGRWVYCICFDDPWRPVLVDTRLLQSFSCRLASHIQYEPADTELEGLPAWRLNTGRAMLVAFIKSLTNHEFVIPKEVTYQEAIRHFEYEGIAVPGNRIDAAADGAKMLDGAPRGIGMRKPEVRPTEALARTVQLVANAVMEWPRLDIGLAASIDGGDVDFTCTQSRVWVRFSERPKLERYGGDEMHTLAKRRPYWLLATLGSIGYVHWRMVEQGTITQGQRDEKAFSLLIEGLEADSAHYYVSVKRDMPRTERDKRRAMIRHADRFASSVLSEISDFGNMADRPQQMGQTVPTSVKFARACISAADGLMRNAPNCAKLFSGDCADDSDKKGNTPERKALERALKMRGAKVVMWKDAAFMRDKNFVPLVFPPSFLSTNNTGGPCALIDFEEHLVSM